MLPFRKRLGTSLAALFMLVGLTSGAHGFGVDTFSYDSFGLGTGRASLQVRGRLVCTACSLAEVRASQPDSYSNHFYQFTRNDERAVIEITWVSNTRRWNHVTVPRIQVRGQDSFIQQIMAEENMFKEIELSGILSPAQVLDLHDVTILG